MKKSAFAAALALGTLTLSACGGGSEEPAAEAANSIPGMTISNARMVLPAVEGNPAAVYFDLAYDGERSLALNRASVEGAETSELHEYGEWNLEMQMQPMLPLPLKQGDKHAFEPGGKHVMAMGVSPELQPGGTTEVTLTVSGGGTISFPAEIRAAGEER